MIVEAIASADKVCALSNNNGEEGISAIFQKPQKIENAPSITILRSISVFLIFNKIKIINKIPIMIASELIMRIGRFCTMI